MICCPVCRSREVYPAAGGYIGQIYLCKDCGYRGSFVLEVDDPAALDEADREAKSSRR